MAAGATITEADILDQIVSLQDTTMSPETAQSLLSLRFNSKATRRIRQLLAKNNRGKITTDERLTLEKYLKVGRFLDLLHAKARLALRTDVDAD